MDTTSLNLRIFRPGRAAYCVIITLLYFYFLPAHSLAESTNKRMVLPGSRAQALAGAFTAVADDASAGWYNPAGLGFLKGPGVSASVNNYSTSKKTISDVAATADLSENSVSVYPGFAGANTNIGGLGFGWSYFTLEQQNTNESQSISITNSNQLASKNILDASTADLQYERSELTFGSVIHTGATMAINLSKNLSLGISEFYYRRQKQTSLKERSAVPSGVFYDSFSRLSTKNEGTLTVAGILLRGEELSVGMSTRIPKALSDKTNYETRYIVYTGGSPELTSDETLTHREDELTARTWNLGVAWTPKPSILISFDAVYYPPMKTAWPNSGGIDTRAVTDFSLGFEIRSSAFLLSGGTFTNSSIVDAPRPSLTTIDPGQINYSGFSAAIGFKSGRSENLFIMVRQRGKGLKQMVQGDPTLQEITIESQTFSLSSSYKL